jgi:hypothetical protein
VTTERFRVRVSEYFTLERTQPSLDFVDVDVEGDVPVFVDPRALRLLNTEWADECVSMVQHFFTTVLDAIRSGNHEKARELLMQLREPNETHLGLSKGTSRGRALGPHSANDLWEALSKSAATKHGLLEDLEDTILMVEGISSDIVSDIATNIIRYPLIKYTHEACATYGIPLGGDVDSGPLWDPAAAAWFNQYVELPVVGDKRLLLVPKVIVRKRMDYDPDEYYRHYILEHLRNAEIAAGSELVRLLKSGKNKGQPRVDIKALKEKYGEGKGVIVRETLRNPTLLHTYRADKNKKLAPPLSHQDFAELEGTLPPNWKELVRAVHAVPTGNADSGMYESAIEQFLSASFYPSLSHPQPQTRIHDGRKRIDITYTNLATEGFFFWLGKHYPAPHIFVECKNYGGEVANPELDQLSGRFSPSRGQFGILVCRSFDNKDLFHKRCRDTAVDHRGYIVALDDADLAALGSLRETNDVDALFKFMKGRFDQLVM